VLLQDPRATATPSTSSTPRHNHLLAALPLDEYHHIASSFEVISLRLKQILHHPGEPIRYVYFPAGGFCSMVTLLKDGRMVEIATIEREGMVGVSALLHGAPVTSVTMVQGETDTCYRMEVEAFRRGVEQHRRFAALLAHFAQALFGFVAQSTACNAVHSVEQRFARWLLMARDRLDCHEFSLTQEFAAMMLGTTRPTVTVVAGTLWPA